MDIPVYLFTGFLESGKTSFILDALFEQNFNEGDKCLIIACEDGEVEYDEKKLRAKNCFVEFVTDVDDFNTETLQYLQNKYHPLMVMIEFNGIWSLAEVFGRLRFPDDWALAQVVSTVDASTFNNYLGNMRSIMYEQLADSEMIVFNRCSENTKKSFLRSNIKAINKTAQIIYESVDGSVNSLPEDALPYDIEAPFIDVSDDDYGLWYVDALDHPERYVGKRVKVKGKAYAPMDDSIADHSFVLARLAMVCCAQDMQPIGFLSYWEHAGKLMDEEWVQVDAVMDSVYDPDYQCDVPVLKVENLKVVPPLTNELVTFS